MKKFIFFLLFLFAFMSLTQGIFAQESDEQETETDNLAQELTGLVPVFPETTPGLIWVEGEQAVITNFANEAVLDYSSSGQRTLQLNRFTELPGNASFFAEYGVYVPEDGIYELWYGGTPAGPDDILLPSYASPFDLYVNGKLVKRVNRESINVVQGYTPNNYWNRVLPIRFNAGSHRIRFEIRDKRRFDGKFLFFLDAFFLINQERFDPSQGYVPPVFPETRSSRDIDNPFQSLAEYELQLKNAPSDIPLHIRVANVYSMVGDYANAIKTLTKAQLLDPESKDVLLLLSKNYIWRGEVERGLNTYLEYLKINPLDEDTWGEAGKIAAWTGRFLQSIEIYQEGLEVFPDSLTLRVNLGLTHLWNNQTDLGEQSFTAALRAAEADPEKILELGDVFRINGVPERSIAVYRRGQQIHPEFLNFYLRLQETLLSLDRQEESQAVSESIQRVFNPSPELSTFIEEFNNKLRLQEEVLSVYEQQLAENPDNIRLRELVVQAYFWNGKRSLAIDQYQDVIINAMYQSFNAFDQEQRPVLELLDRLYLLRGFLIQAQNARLVQTDLQRTLQELDQALADLRDMPTAESQGIEAQSSRIDSLQEDLAQQEAQLRLWVDIIEEAAAQQEKLEVIRSAIIDQDDQDKLRFESLTEATGWQWDPSLTRGELQKVRIRGNPLAESILGTLEKINENFELVGPLVTGEGHQTLALSSRTDSQAAFWKSGGESLPESFGVHGTHGPSLDTLAASLNPSLDSPAVYSALTPENSQEVLARMSQELPQLSSRLTAIDREIRLAHEILRRKLGLHFYIFDVNNKLRRFQLGSYLMTEGRHEEALDQFNNVIAVDPWNISARYNKGVLQELSRDWKGAMNTYREVYNNDPNFENVITRHNALARLHPDRTFVQISTTSDNNRVTQSAQGSILMQPSSFLSLTTHLLMSDVRFVNPSDIENPGNYAYTDTYLNVDAYLPFLDWIKYRAAGGLTVNQKLQMAETGDSIMLGQYFDSLEIHPFFAAGVTLELGGFNLTVDANREVVRDSLFDSRTRAFNHEATLAGNWFVSVPGSSSINFFNGRVYTSLGRIENEGTDFGNNQIGGGVDLGASFRLLADPLTNLEIRGVVDFQNGQAPWVNNYYSPDQVLLSKLQATYSSWINLGGENILAAIFQLNGGLYQDNILEKSAQNYVLLSGLGKLELTQGGANYFLFSDLNWTFQDITAPTYWTFTIGLGGNFSLSNFLLP